MVLSTAHWPVTAIVATVVRAIHQETGAVVMHLNVVPQILPDDLMMAEFGFTWGEDVLMLAALKILGWHGAYDPACDVEKSIEYATDGLRAFVPFEDAVVVPSIFAKDYRHTGLRSGLTLDDAERVIRVMQQGATGFDELPALFAAYQAKLEALARDKPWESPEIWSV